MWCDREKPLRLDSARKGGAFVFFPGRVKGVLLSRWPWLALVGLSFAAAGFLGGYSTGCYTATVTLIPDQTPQPQDPPAMRRSKVETLAEMVRSRELAGRVVQGAGAPVTAERLQAVFEVSPVPGTDLLRLSLRDRNADQAAFLLNLYARQALLLAQEAQSNATKEIKHSLEEKMSVLDQSLELAKQRLSSFQGPLGFMDFDKEASSYVQQYLDLDQKSENLRVQAETLNLQTQNLLKEISNHHPAVLAARQELSEALLRYTEDHPHVQKLRATLAALQAQIAERGDQIDPDVVLKGNSLAQSLYTKLLELRTEKVTLMKQMEAAILSRNRLKAKLDGLPEKRLEFAKLSSEFASLNAARETLLVQQQQTLLTGGQAAGFSSVFTPVQSNELSRSPKWKSGERYSLGAGLLGLCLAGSLIFRLEMTDRRIRTEADLKQVTALPVLGTLGDLSRLSAQELEQWAFTTLTRLRGSLGHPGSGALVCGFIASHQGEGCSTWVELLSSAARRCGYQVLTVSARDSGQASSERPMHSDTCAHSPQPSLLPARFEFPVTPMPLESKLEIPMSRWVWDLQNRQQWQEAVRRWRGMENVAVFIDFPPASTPEAILLSENFSDLIWLCGRDMADFDETHAQLESLRCAGSRLSGAVFNRALRTGHRNHVGQLVSIGAALMFAFTPRLLSAQEAGPRGEPQERPGLTTNGSFSVSSPTQLAAWQKHLTLGAGDVLTISLYEQPDSERKGLAIGPDGRLNYLQARDVVAADLTVDELRERLETVLAKFYRPPLRVIIIPQSYTSKKYYLLGNVVQKGVFPLDRPVTIIEAIAHAQGFVTTIERRSTLMQADLPRAFLIRKSEGTEPQRVNVDFEALFLRGDLSQNVPLAPGDYLYFPPLDLQEIYILGEVLRPGVSTYTPELTALRAVASRGGFGERAFRQRVLIVRGSLNHPQTLVLNVSDILKARSADVKLEARDIVYVSRKPWFKAEELVQSAVSDFVRAAVITWTGKKVAPLINY